jgi:uncharacterized protein YbaR (Trm112 family)
MTFDAELLDLVACPSCHASFAPPSADPQTLTCSGCGLAFPVVEGIPVLLISDAIAAESSHEADA